MTPSQRAREAAALTAEYQHKPQVARQIREGKADENWRVQAFDRFEAETPEGAEWQPIETAPRDGTQFLALVSNGWYALASAPRHLDWPYQWWQTSDRQCYPVVETHPADTDWSRTYTLFLTNWMPLPPAPETHNER